LHFTGRTRDMVAALLTRMLTQHGARRIGSFLHVLEILARSRSCRPISSAGFTPELNPHDEDRVSRVWEFINRQLDGPLNVPAAARLVHMSDGAFSRFFRARMGKSFPALVNELRVGRACRLLAETDGSVTEIALACGYSNLSNFNRQFLRLKRVTPRAFRRQLAQQSGAAVLR